MNEHKVWTAMAVLVMVAVLALGWFLGIDPRLADARAADAERAQVERDNLAHEQTLAELARLERNLPALEAELAGLRAALPTDAAIPPLIGELDDLAVRNGMEIVSFTIDAPAEVEAEAAAQQQGGAAEADGTDDAASGEASPEPVRASVTTSPAQIPAGVVSIPVTVEVQGSPDGLAGFIESVQTGKRLFLLTDLDITWDGGGSTGTLTGLVYVLAEDGVIADDEPHGEAAG